MNGERRKFWPLVLCLLALVWLQPASAQGFAGLGTGADGFAEVQPGPFDFPADHGAHPGFRIEWWYVTANLQDANGTEYGAQWTLFRSALSPDGPQVWMAHAALTSPTQHFLAERLGRDGTGQSGVTARPFAAWVDEWELSGPTPDNVRMFAQGVDFAYDLKLAAQGPLVAQGDGGLSVKSAAGQASRYYSQPFYTVSGTVTLPEGDVAVTGQAWLDREWSSQLLNADQQGWDWISLHFDNGEKLMGFVLRDGSDGFTSGTWIAADGTAAPFGDGALRLTAQERHRVAGRRVPVVWRVELPERGIDVTISAINRDAWMDTLVPYWEGPVTIKGTHSGRGYLEMTGYE